MEHAGDHINTENANWSFEGKTAEHFDEHVSKSVPFYHEGQTLICNISDYFIKNDSIAYEIGCSTGELTSKLAMHNKSKAGAQFIGIDTVPEMIEIANTKKEALKLDALTFEVDDVLSYNLEDSDLIISYYTVQFIRPSDRQR
ncbi:MAG: class I SAM-dependent methyltransferase, partial [Victivallales bacterium]|nr:class I SAM-dependent methyltransferase [Victivallales bacterium]